MHSSHLVQLLHHGPAPPPWSSTSTMVQLLRPWFSTSDHGPAVSTTVEVLDHGVRENLIRLCTRAIPGIPGCPAIKKRMALCDFIRAKSQMLTLKAFSQTAFPCVYRVALKTLLRRPASSFIERTFSTGSACLPHAATRAHVSTHIRSIAEV